MMRKNSGSRSERGIALVSVLWALMLLSLLVLSVMTLVRVQDHYTATVGQRSRAIAAADAGIHVILQRLSDPGAVRNMPAKVTSLPLMFAGHDMTVSLLPESGKIDLNAGHEVLVGALLAYHGMAAADAERVAEALRGMREKDEGAVFKITADIRRIGRIDSGLYRCIAPYLTVYSNQLGVDYAAAAADMKAMINWADKKRWGGQNWLEISGGATGGLVSGTRSILQQTGSHAGRAFTVRAEVAFGAGGKVTRTAVVRLTGNRRDPFWVYRWATATAGDRDGCETREASAPG